MTALRAGLAAALAVAPAPARVAARVATRVATRTATRVAALVAALVAVPVLAPASPAGAMPGRPPPTVVSINLCADQLVLELADPEQILAVSALARDPRGAVHHRRAARHRTVTGQSAEQLVALGPDLVVAGPFTSRHTLALLAELDVRVETLPIAESIEAMRDNVAAVGRWLGQERRAAARLADVDARLAAVAARTGGPGIGPDPEPDLAAPLAAVYDANGYTVGADTLRGEALGRAGWRNVAAEAGISGYGALPLESLIARAPDAIVSSPFDAGSYSRGQSLTRHPALRAAGLDPVLVDVPSRLTICAGPWSVDVVERLAAAREAFEARRGEP